MSFETAAMNQHLLTPVRLNKQLTSHPVVKKLLHTNAEIRARICYIYRTLYACVTPPSPLLEHRCLVQSYFIHVALHCPASMFVVSPLIYLFVIIS